VKSEEMKPLFLVLFDGERPFLGDSLSDWKEALDFLYKG